MNNNNTNQNTNNIIFNNQTHNSINNNLMFNHTLQNKINNINNKNFAVNPMCSINNKQTMNTNTGMNYYYIPKNFSKSYKNSPVNLKMDQMFPNYNNFNNQGKI